MTTTHTAETTEAPAVVEGHRVRCLEQIPNRNRNRYPTTGQWTCECGETGRVRAPWGSQVDASLAAHRRHAAAAAADSLMVEPDEPETSESFTSQPDSSPLNVRATIRRPDGDTFVAFAGQVPAWLWDDAHTRDLWKRENRGHVLTNANLDRKARGYRVTFEAWDPEEARLV